MYPRYNIYVRGIHNQAAAARATVLLLRAGCLHLSAALLGVLAGRGCQYTRTPSTVAARLACLPACGVAEQCHSSLQHACSCCCQRDDWPAAIHFVVALVIGTAGLGAGSEGSAHRESRHQRHDDGLSYSVDVEQALQQLRLPLLQLPGPHENPERHSLAGHLLPRHL